MNQVDEYGRPEPPPAGDEVASLLGFLDYQRATLAWKCADLDAAGLAVTVGVSSLTLGGLLKHVALVEVDWFVRNVHGGDLGEPWTTVADARAGDGRIGEWAWRSAADDAPDELRALWRTSVERARAATAEALDAGGLDTPTHRRWPDGFRPSLRWILLHMIEEYARHNGHADLLREAVDGSVGE